VSVNRLLAFFLVASPISAGAVETLRIAMGGPQARATLSGRFLQLGPDSEEGNFAPIELAQATVRVTRTGLEVNGAAWTGDAMRFRSGKSPDENSAFGSEEIRVGALRVRGDVVVRQTRGLLQLINVLSLEEYLVGVLGSEMPHDFPEEALKAQAVAARTYALNKKLTSYDEPYHLGSSVLHQVYGGLNREDPRARAAVEATRGEVLTYDLEPIEAYFHASCGGRTESGLAALGRDLPYLHPVDCPCGRLSSTKWELDLSQHELKSALGSKEEVSLSAIARSGTGRVRSVRASPELTLDAASFRQRLGYTRLKSLWFDIESVHSDSVKITGRGYGHGAGLCQWGARLYAQKGWSYREILAHYYSGVELQRLY
jgi:stage II sporulation protein D